MLAWRGAGGTLFSDGDIIHQRIQSPRTLFTSEYCPGGHYSRGDIIHSDNGKKGGTFFTKEGTVFPSESCPRGTNFTREFCPGGH